MYEGLGESGFSYLNIHSSRISSTFPLIRKIVDENLNIPSLYLYNQNLCDVSKF